MLKLVIGNKNYSSWSMRPWLALRANNIAFEEIFIPLYTDVQADKERILSFSHSGKVPALIEGTASLKGVELMRGAVAALAACQPYAMLPADRYGEWKALDLSFTPRDFNS